jgi:hypothetical protein
MKTLVISGVVLVFTLSAMLIGGCTSGGKGVGELQKVEIREYEGENLSSINEFRENSIKRPTAHRYK